MEFEWGHLPFGELRVVLGSFVIFTVESGDHIGQFSRSHWDWIFLVGKNRCICLRHFITGVFFHYNIALVAFFVFGTYFIIKIFGFFFFF